MLYRFGMFTYFGVTQQYQYENTKFFTSFRFWRLKFCHKRSYFPKHQSTNFAKTIQIQLV